MLLAIDSGNTNIVFAVFDDEGAIRGEWRSSSHADRTADEFGDMIRRQFDVLYRESVDQARVMAIALHPFLVGVPHRSKYLEQALSYIAGHRDVWMCTGDDIYNWYASEYGG